MALARNQPFLDQPIDGHTDRSRCEPDLWADGIDRERPLVKERFEDAEIRVAQFRLLNAPFRLPGESLKGFHEDEPEMHARGVFCLPDSFFPHEKLFLD